MISTIWHSNLAHNHSWLYYTTIDNTNNYNIQFQKIFSDIFIVKFISLRLIISELLILSYFSSSCKALSFTSSLLWFLPLQRVFGQLSHPHEQPPPLFLFRTEIMTAAARAHIITDVIIISARLIIIPPYEQHKLNSQYTAADAAYAIVHCQNTRPADHFLPSSLLTDAIAATHGVYSRLKTSIDNAVAIVSEEVIFPV